MKALTATSCAPAPALQKAFGAACTAGKEGQGLVAAFERGEEVGLGSLRTIKEELSEGLRRFRSEWEGQRVETPAGQTIWTPDYIGLREAVPASVSVDGCCVIGEGGRVVAVCIIDARLKDITLLAGLTKVRVLNLATNAIRDIRPLAGLTSLTELSLQFNQISDLRPLSGLGALKNLDLRGNPVTDLAPISGCSGLQGLWVVHNDFFAPPKPLDAAPLAALTGLRTLTLHGYRIRNLCVLEGLPNLKELSVRCSEIVKDKHVLMTLRERGVDVEI